MKNIFSELNRRNVLRTVLFYAAACWLLLQISETVLPVFGVPDWILRFIILALAIGFVPVILFSWVYEITPEGIKKDNQVDRQASISSATGRKISIATVVLLVAIVALTFLRPQADTTLPISSSLAQGVAVLPFENI